MSAALRAMQKFRLTTGEGMQQIDKNKPVTHGYARCSTNEEKQDIDRQVRELKAAGAQKIWLEYGKRLIRTRL